MCTYGSDGSDEFSFPESSREPRILVNCQYSFLRKEGTMKKINVPGDPKTWAVFLPDVSRS